MFNPDPKNITPKVKKTYTLKRSSLKNKRKVDSIPDLLEKATIVFNAFIRKRDEGQPCISCGQMAVLQAGHYYSAGSFPNLRFKEKNTNGQCEWCNCFKGGNLDKYREGLINKIGLEEVGELDRLAVEYKKAGYKWNQEFLIEIINKYKV